MGFRTGEVEDLLVRTGRRCCICFGLHSVQVHHIVRPEDGGTHDIDNAIPLCPTCHDQVHGTSVPGRVTRVYSASELKKHRQRTIDQVQRALNATLDQRSPVTAAHDLLNRLTSQNTSLSSALVEAFELARKIQDQELMDLCEREIGGYDSTFGNADVARSIAPYRIVYVFLATDRHVNPSGFRWTSAGVLFHDLEHDPEIKDKFIKNQTFLGTPISSLEEWSKGSYNQLYFSMSFRLGDLLPQAKKPDTEVLVYGDPRDYVRVCMAVREKLTKELLRISKRGT